MGFKTFLLLTCMVVTLERIIKNLSGTELQRSLGHEVCSLGITGDNIMSLTQKFSSLK